MFPPYSEPDFGGEGRRGHGGFEYEIAAAAAGSLGLNLVLRPPSTGVMWGSRVEGTDNFTGTTNNDAGTATKKCNKNSRRSH